MHALTVWAPWSSLIMIGAKPFEFRGWNFTTRPNLRSLVGKRVVIHAGSRPMKLEEVEDLLERLGSERDAWTTGLRRDIAEPFLERVHATLLHDGMARRAERKAARRGYRELAPAPALPGFDDAPESAADLEIADLPGALRLPLAHGLGTVVLHAPRKLRSKDLGGPVNDSARAEHSNWAWPVSHPQPFEPPVPARGAQGFWTWSRS